MYLLEFLALSYRPGIVEVKKGMKEVALTEKGLLIIFIYMVSL